MAPVSQLYVISHIYKAWYVQQLYMPFVASFLLNTNYVICYTMTPKCKGFMKKLYCSTWHPYAKARIFAFIIHLKTIHENSGRVCVCVQPFDFSFHMWIFLSVKYKQDIYVNYCKRVYIYFSRLGLKSYIPNYS